MSEVIVVASFVAKPGREGELEKFLADLLDETHQEPGCLLYALNRGLTDPSRLVYVERWENLELLTDHLNSDHIQTALAEVGTYLAQDPDIVYYEEAPGGHADKGSISGHAASA
ncbi:quinol monooxygenase YgiN [Nocardioides thalensis]|uniref:Quinol monooxygenase YgiN n=1 Tax=Nocardioides thalensis TaxID=1914755 RepID=A0A853C3M4_9ACTN|nr:putative quinol monooxygenase [Nocardioides thalensis]NYJ01994.1 quinol monooxygenase YgiN [Nocardioides thalensis]